MGQGVDALKKGGSWNQPPYELRLYSTKMEIYKKSYENAANRITHDYHLIEVSKVITLDILTSTEICSILILKVQNKPSSNISKMCLLTTILTGQQFMCYHA